MTSMTLAVNPVRRAFWDQHNVIFLGSALLFALALWSPLPLAIGVFAELFWLGIVAQTRAFRSFASRFDANERRTASARALAAETTLLDGALAARARTLAHASDAVIDALHESAAFTPSELPRLGHAVERVQREFLGFARLLQRVGAARAEIPALELALEVKRLQASLTAEREIEMRMTLRRALSVAERRLDQAAKLEGTERTLELRLQTLEKSVAFLKSRVPSLNSAEDFEHEISALLSNVGSAEELGGLVGETLGEGVPASSLRPPATGFERAALR